MSNNWSGKKFTEWYDIYENDTRRVHYRVSGEWDEEIINIQFTSDSYVDSIWILRMLFMKIKSAYIIKNEWYVSLCN